MSPHAPLVLVLSLAACAPGGPGAPSPADPSGTVELACDRRYEDALRQTLDGGASVAQWELYPGERTALIADQLVETGSRLLLDDELSVNAEAVERLQSRGVAAELIDDPTVRMHAKVAASPSRALVGSTNWSDAAIERNRECNLLVTGGELPAALQAWIEALPGGRRGPVLPSPAEPALLVDDEILPALLAAAETAERSIDLTVYAVGFHPDDPDAPATRLFQALVDAVNRGVPIRVLLEWSDWNPDITALNQPVAAWLEGRGVQVRWDRPDVVLHAKTHRFDDRLQIQSANPSTSGFERNREAAIATSDPAVVADWQRWFEARWSEGRAEGW